MPRTILEGFRDFLARLTPSSLESEVSRLHRSSLENCLKSNFGIQRFAQIGSFGNATSISGFSDVDYLACLPTNQLTRISTSSLTKVRNALDARFPTTGVHVRCPAVVVPFGTTAAGRTEIVPADFVKHVNGYNIYDIPDCAGGWMNASPDAHNAYVRSWDEHHARKLKPLIRFIKAWKYFREVPINSFYLELRVTKYASTEQTIIYDEDICRFFKFLWDGQLPMIQDPMGISGYISPCKSDALREEALSKLETALTRVEKARVCSTNGYIKDSFDWWRLLYNDQFPTYYN